LVSCLVVSVAAVVLKLVERGLDVCGISRFADLEERDAKAPDSLAYERIDAHDPRHLQPGSQDAVLQDIGLVVVISTLEFVRLPVVVADLSIHEQASPEHGDRFLSDHVVLQNSLADDTLAFLYE
jgi:hypothetical protein